MILITTTIQFGIYTSKAVISTDFTTFLEYRKII